MREKAFLKAAISNFKQESYDGVPKSYSVSLNDNESSDIDEILPFEYVEMFHTDVIFQMGRGL